MPQIVCPKCQHSFEPTDALREEIQKDLRSKMQEWQLQKESEYKKREDQFQHQLAEKDKEARQMLESEKQKMAQTLEAHIRKQVSSDFEMKLSLLQSQVANQETKLSEARQRELEFIMKEQALLDKEKELDLKLQRTLLEEKSKITESIRQEEASKTRQLENDYQLKVKEWEEKFEQQKRLAEEMKRKAEQGSMQTQGEVQELMLEEMLRHAFPFDRVEEVAKGVRGADCIQTVRNQYGQECGKIIFESKRTQAFSAEWIEKLKADMRSQGAELAVLVTQAMPKDLDRFGEKEGVWICSFHEVKPLVHVLRMGMVNLQAAMKNEENKGDKMNMLYAYLTGNEFNEQWKAIREGFLQLRQSIFREREQMEKLWKAREKQLEKVLLNMAHFKGSIEGISGQDIGIDLLEDGGQPASLSE